MQPKIKIVIADDHPVFRNGLRNIIDSDRDMKVVGEAENGLIAIEQVKKLSPEILILDLKMPVLDGIEAAKIISVEFPKIKIIFLTLEIDSDTIDNLKKFRIKGYLLKESAVTEIVNCIKYVASGKMYMSPDIIDVFMQTVDNSNKEMGKESLISTLTPTETRILRLLAKAKTNKEISLELFISEHTCAKHRSNMCTKLGLSGNHSLLRFAIENKDLILKSN